ncbi:GAF domain-containing protein, partial [bacterium]|nr:GAF domain-containing protein [bacterium]
RIHRVRDDPRFNSDVDCKLTGSTQSILCVPMVAKDKIIGTIQVINKPDDEGFCKSDEEALQAFANQAAIAIERFRLHETLHAQAQRIQGIFEALTDGIIVVDTAGNPIMYNRAVEDMFFPGGLQNYALTTYLSNVIRRETPIGSSEVVLFKPHNIILSNRYVTLSDSNGQPCEVVVSIRNITEQHGIDRRFSQFYAIMLHNLNKLMKKVSSEKNVKKLRKLLKKQRFLIRNLLFLSELKSGPLRIEKSTFDLISTYLGVKAKMESQIAKRGIVFNDSQLCQIQSPKVGAERRRMVQVFFTLFDRAIKTLSRGESFSISGHILGEKISFEGKFLGKSVQNFITPQCLDWNIQVDRILSGEDRSLNLDLAFLRHIVLAHKGATEISTKPPNEVIVRFDVPILLES